MLNARPDNTLYLDGVDDAAFGNVLGRRRPRQSGPGTPHRVPDDQAWTDGHTFHALHRNRHRGRLPCNRRPSSQEAPRSECPCSTARARRCWLRWQRSGSVYPKPNPPALATMKARKAGASTANQARARASHRPPRRRPGRRETADRDFPVADQAPAAEEPAAPAPAEPAAPPPEDDAGCADGDFCVEDLTSDEEALKKEMAPKAAPKLAGPSGHPDRAHARCDQRLAADRRQRDRRRHRAEDQDRHRRNASRLPVPAGHLTS
jgi:hypothetical protein